MANFLSAQRHNHAYEAVPVAEDGEDQSRKLIKDESKKRWLKKAVVWPVALSIGFALKLLFLIFDLPNAWTRSCDDLQHGYKCRPEISRFWGQYSPYFSVPSEISPNRPAGCQVTFAQILSRHGARDPTAGKTQQYNATIYKLKSNVDDFSGAYAFLRDYEYTLGADQLTAFGEAQLVNSGKKFYKRYRHLTKRSPIFVRASGQKRVVKSAKRFNQGYHGAYLDDESAEVPDNYPYPILVLSEAHGSSNPLSNDLCDKFQDPGPGGHIGSRAMRTWAKVFATPITSRLNNDLPGANFSLADTINLIELCPYETVASPTGKISPFCALFTEKEWHQYDYYESLGKYYGWGNGNPLGPTQGVGFVNELIARMTNRPVRDHTSVNHTLDDSLETFPIGAGRVLFADFSHDNDMTGIYSALGLYNSTSPLPMTSIQTADDSNGYSAAWTVPFGARAYFEKLDCEGEDEELVRVLVNDRVIPLDICKGDSLGRCKLSAFIRSLSFAAGGGNWDQCFAS